MHVFTHVVYVYVVLNWQKPKVRVQSHHAHTHGMYMHTDLLAVYTCITNFVHEVVAQTPGAKYSSGY